MNDDRHTPAMPNPGEGEWLDPQTCKQWRDYTGLSKAEYAAIHTGQPCSGTPWLDEMIAKGRRERLAGHIMSISDSSVGEHVAAWAINSADALIAALEGGDK